MLNDLTLKSALAKERELHEAKLWADRQALDLERAQIERLKASATSLNDQAHALRRAYNEMLPRGWLHNALPKRLWDQ
jgi:hypothetical protein